MRQTKDSLLKQNLEFSMKIGLMEATDLKMRTILSELLGSFEYTTSSDYGFSGRNKDKKVDVKEWVGIAFLIGELKADADYSILISEKVSLQNQNDNLRQRIIDLETPKE